MAKLEKKLYKEVVVPSRRSFDYGLPGRTYVGFSTTDPTRKGVTVYDFECIKQDIINHFHIRQGEKLGDPTFGTIIWDVLFEPLTDTLKEAITKNVTEICNFDPRVAVDKITVDQYDHGVQIEASILYRPYNLTEYMQLRFDQRAGFLLPTTQNIQRSSVPFGANLS
jgi:phage baseplate assembly protein W